jgi:hypothetical protein
MEPRTTQNARKGTVRDEGWGFHLDPAGFRFLDRINRIYRFEGEEILTQRPGDPEGRRSQPLMGMMNTDTDYPGIASSLCALRVLCG